VSTTYLAILEELAKRTGLGRLGIATAAGTAATIADSQRMLGLVSPAISIGAPILITSGARAGNHTYVQAEPPKTTGILSVAPDLAGALTIADTFQVWNSDFGHVDRVKECVNRALTQWCARRVLVPLAILLDGDMEKTGYADWTAATSAALAKAAMAEGAPVRQALGVTNASLAGYAYQEIAVQPNDQLAIVCCCRSQSGATHTPKLVVYDVTNAATISLSGDGGTALPGVTWQVLRNSFVVPTGCRAVQIRLGVATAADDVYWAWVALTQESAREVVLPDRTNRANRVGRVYRAHRAVSSPYEPPGSWQLEEVTGVEKVATRGTGGVVLRFPGMLGDYLYLYEEYQPYTALSALSDTTEVPLDWAVAASAYECFDLLWGQWREGQASRAPMPGQMDPNPYAASRQRWMSRLLAERALALGQPHTVFRTA